MERMGLKVEVRIGVNQLKVTVGDKLDETAPDVQTAFAQLREMKARETARLEEIKRHEEMMANMGFSTRIGAC